MIGYFPLQSYASDLVFLRHFSVQRHASRCIQCKVELCTVRASLMETPCSICTCVVSCLRDSLSPYQYHQLCSRTEHSSCSSGVGVASLGVASLSVASVALVFWPPLVCYWGVSFVGVDASGTTGKSAFCVL